ncbi:MAG: hypothetical protein ILNGONEN_00305 [Syntrophorhabdaceae bacterium]|nr:hypothetical protein [Syntrophorhabdaceae bacterium]
MNEWPSLDELITLNPRLQARSRRELSELVSTIKSCGWKWNPSQKQFELLQLDKNIRTQGLDLFTATTFKRHHNFIVSIAKSYPKEYVRYVYGMTLWQKNWVTILLLLLGDLTLGWMILELRIWFASLIMLIFSMVALYKFSRTMIAPYQEIENRLLTESIMRDQNHPS